MNLLQMRVRTALISATGVLNAIPKLPKIVLGDEIRKRLIVSMLEEQTWAKYRTLPAGYSHVRPPYVGQTLELLKTLFKSATEDDVYHAYRCLANATEKLLARSYGLWPEGFPEEGLDSGYPGGALLFDHGVSYRFYKNYILAVWLRPTVDMKEMSVASYIDFIYTHCGDIDVKGYTVRELTQSLPIGDFLSDVHTDYLERKLCSTSK
ncbi:hypothetical protein pSALSNUABM04_092 [Salmonella phage pSal-SNUABM-04]|nr:hypothetical protein pSALSNUABM04_092 [Salmonella phage pSal-SNUABM-04]